METNNFDKILPKPFIVKKFKKETHDTFTIDLISKSSKFDFKPGQFNMLYLFGIGEVPVSISGNAQNAKTFIHTIRSVGTVTKKISKIKSGSVIGVRGPFGSHWPIEEAKGKNILIIAGGIGLAPLRPVIYNILDQRKSFNKVALLYGARSMNDILYYKELETWRAKLDFDLHVTVDRGDKNWRGEVGVVTTLIKKISMDWNNTIAFICGPEIMMRFVLEELLDLGMKENEIYISMERNMKCAVGICGHCQIGKEFVCKDGPVFKFSRMKDYFLKREL